MLIPVILSGGAGTRLWPVSRESYPKPFIRMPDGRSLLQRAYLGAAGLPGVEHVALVTNRDYYFQSRDELDACARSDLPPALSYLLEPCGRNTAPAIALAALKIADQYGPEAIMLVLPADHLIEDSGAFAAAVAAATAAAAEGMIVTFGISPSAPETGFGYIEIAAESPLPGAPGAPQVFRIARFVEKPARAAAERYLAEGRHLWNAGMFCVRADTMLRALAGHAPELHAAALACFAASVARRENAAGGTFELDPASFAALPDISIDYAVMERADNAAVVRAAFDWSDIGSWSALAALTPPDADGNRVEGEALLIDSTELYVRSEGRLVAGVGLSRLVVIDTPDALLIADRDRSQEVKGIVERLKRDAHASVRLHRTVHRPWGTYTVLEEGRNFKIKRLSVKPGAALSLQMHYHRSEHWVVVGGTARVRNGEADLLIRTNESTYIPAGHKHRLENPGLTELVIIEVQSGEYLGEDDIVRFDDVYGRTL
ncbi:MAG TPA: mannose-1-phosphate guanylyltransferase/mannose-6-phosphate isomerase [Rhodocyclaceae bacterium]|nr:mannose-1-phosphate guanylyltransferase/mannose-6-phosphate isomerase [Rhodocyclaceae bacterium]